ncbi:hypothetical protein Thimo_0200 [Thioflavicoccus mobilis 8321]|uniref:Uncharacterized protein n=1 Tax=Thioflavicoccus mobilis 8321 TaxID=765912 RepID=L0GQR0_9GAMM|nr:hypothetical protein [Thioflavicoccus mobilis]AGA89073.1 hypothetical protein Thimo_0200 [Thioflavicoccus mobilis 8321]
MLGLHGFPRDRFLFAALSPLQGAPRVPQVFQALDQRLLFGDRQQDGQAVAVRVGDELRVQLGHGVVSLTGQ